MLMTCTLFISLSAFVGKIRELYFFREIKSSFWKVYVINTLSPALKKLLKHVRNNRELICNDDDLSLPLQLGRENM